MDNINKLKENFIKEFEEYAQYIFVNENGKSINYSDIDGVSFIPIYIYKEGINGHDKNLFNRACVITGCEKDGFFVNQFNWLGGKVSDKADDKVDLKKILEIFFEEVYEEFGILLTSKIMNSIIYTYFKPFGEKYSLIFICHMTDITIDKWKAVMTKRGIPEKSLKPYNNKYHWNLEWKYQEMSIIEHTPIDEKLDKKYYSKYVLETLFEKDLKTPRNFLYPLTAGIILENNSLADYFIYGVKHNIFKSISFDEFKTS